MSTTSKEANVKRLEETTARSRESTAKAKADQEAMYQAMRDAWACPPGSRLSYQEIADLADYSRSRVRQIVKGEG